MALYLAASVVGSSSFCSNYCPGKVILKGIAFNLNFEVSMLDASFSLVAEVTSESMIVLLFMSLDSVSMEKEPLREIA